MELDLYDVRTVKSLMSMFGLSFRKEFGQNFLKDRHVITSIADSCGASSDDTILEIGPGIGTLTRELSGRYPAVYSVEIDKGLIPLLRYTLEDCKNVHVIQEDIMKTDLSKLYHEEMKEAPVSVCANLPYYITTPIIMMLLQSGIPFNTITVMVQKEVARRLCAPVGSKDAGAVTAYLAYYGQSEIIMDVSRDSFIPVPGVDSSVMTVRPYVKKKVNPHDEKLFFKTIRVIFEQRRKTLLNALSLGFPEMTKESITALLDVCGLEPTVRGEKLSLEKLTELSDQIGYAISS